MICHCGRTVLEPPIPCGTRIACTYPCARPPPPCGHPKTQHACHEDPTPCVPCIFLASKQCACGKKMVDNVRCSQEKVSCGTKCGKYVLALASAYCPLLKLRHVFRLLACGYHHCERSCHGDACGKCNALCGKSRKLWYVLVYVSRLEGILIYPTLVFPLIILALFLAMHPLRVTSRRRVTRPSPSPVHVAGSANPSLVDALCQTRLVAKAASS